MYRLITFLLLFFVSSNLALFGFGSRPTTISPVPAPSKGKEINIPLTDENEGGIIIIPSNNPSTKKSINQPATPTTTIPILTKRPSIGDFDYETTTAHSKFTASTKILPSSNRNPSSGCPSRIDAYSFGPNNDYAFYEQTVWIIKNNRIVEETKLEHEFPSGPKRVNGALYDAEREIFILIEEREVYGFKEENGKWKLLSVFPKSLPSNIGFTPESIVKWHNKHQVLLSNGGKFALYDEYWNKSLLSGRTSSYFENLPDRVRGISVWIDGTSFIFTQSNVFQYDADKKNVVTEGKPLGDFWKC